ncbi:ABC transporter ATP-binding protein [Streptomyces sp. SID5468]
MVDGQPLPRLTRPDSAGIGAASRGHRPGGSPYPTGKKGPTAMAGVMPVEVEDLTYEIAGRQLLNHVGLSVRAGESVAVMGPSGAGKSTLLSLLLGLVRPDSGRILVAGQDVAALRGGKLAAFRRAHVGMVFQFGELLPELKPVENVALAGLLGGSPGRTAYARAGELLDAVGLAGLGAVTTAELSGGERQRVAVARALMGAPDLLLADEPTGSLDEESRAQIAALLFAAPKEHGCALVVVTHDATVAARADRVLRLRAGELVPGGAG